MSAAEGDIQLFWGEPLAGLAERIDRPRELSNQVDRRLKPLRFGLGVTTVVRDTTEEAWRAAEERVARMASGPGDELTWTGNRKTAVGQQRLYGLAARGEVLDTCLYTTPGKFGGGGAATTWLVGSAADVATALDNYRKLGITHFVLSDTPCKQEIIRVGDQLLPRLRLPRRQGWAHMGFPDVLTLHMRCFTRRLVASLPVADPVRQSRRRDRTTQTLDEGVASA
ncbi:LLM class flavin-dependent oxidoreductase [Streptomyces sp. SAS_276]|uniref:LLM class flavin-dependent oxidoreductase n=1 Tax=Streptomyces sp. SAS_276 TaxID=3412745 RepID=UPI00403C21FF